MKDQKRILREFQWFQVQTKVREIIAQILHPLQKRVMSNSTSISKLNDITRQEKYKLQQITLMINNDEDIFKQGIFKNIEEKFQNQTILIRQLQHKIQYLQGYINSKAKILDKRLQESTQVLNGINDFKDYVKQEFNNQSKKIIETHANVLENFDVINKEISSNQIQIDQLKGHQQALVKRIQLAESIVKQANHRLDERLLQFYKSVKQVKTATQINGGHLVLVKEQLLRMSSYQKMLSKLQSLFNEQIIRIDNLQFKIQVIQPVISFTQINEYAHHILPEKYHKNISIYYYNRYNELIEEILNNNFDQKRMPQSVKGNIQLIKQAHKRAIKMVFKLKKQQLSKRGINIQLLSHEKKEQQLASLKLQQNFQGIDEGDAQIAKKVVLQDDAPNATTQQINSMMKQLKEKIELQLNDSKKYIENMEFQLKKDQQNLEKNMNNIHKQLTQLNLCFQLQQKMNRQFSSSVGKSMNSMKQQFKSIKLAMRQIHDIILIFNEIQKQDEKDRQAITLLGIRQKHKDEIRQDYEKKINRSVVQLQQSCLSCSGNPNYYNQFFKMACLTYASSPIRYDNNLYERIEILDKLQHQLQSVHQVLFQKGKKQIELGLQTQRKQIKQEQMLTQRYNSNQIMKLPSREGSSISDRYIVRNVSSSQQIRSKFMPQSPQQPRIINPNELTNQLLTNTRNRLFSRKLERSIRQSQTKKQDKSHQRTSYMKNLSKNFIDLKKQHQIGIKY